MQDISITEARSQLGELANKVKYSGDPIMLTKNGKATVGLVPAHVAEEWLCRRDSLAALVEKARANVASTGLTEEAIIALVDRAIDEARSDQIESAIATIGSHAK